MSFESVLRTALLATLAASGTVSAADWLQWGHDPAHTGNNVDEHTIDAGNVAQLGLLYQSTLTSAIDSAPVYRSNVQTADGLKNLLFVSSEDGRLIALDAATGTALWSKTIAGTSPTAASPALDPFADFVYVYGLDGKVHKYALADGTETTDGGWPQIATLKPGVEKGASALAIATSGSSTFLYAVNDGYVGDGGDYQGHITTINLVTGTQTVFNSLCSDVTIHMVLNGQNGINDCHERQNGIWGRPGASYDAGTDRVYITTGNGLFDANTGGLHWGDSVLALKPDGTGGGAGLPVDSYTPTNYSALDGQDIDLGSASLLVLQPPTGSTVAHLGLQTGKDSKLRLIDLDNMSGTGAPGGVGGEIELIDVPVSEFWMKTQPVTWVDTDGDGATWIYMANGAGISGLKLTLTAANVPHLQPTWQMDTDATSAIVANGLVYHIGGCGNGNCIVARDPHDGSVLWTSSALGSVKWGSPILVDGKLFFADRSRKLWAFGLTETPSTHVVTPGSSANGAISPAWPQNVVDGTVATFALRADPHYMIDSVTGCAGALVGRTYTTAAITADCSINATFVPLPVHTVTPAAGANGRIDPNVPQSIDDGSSTTFIVTADTGFIIDAVSGCGGSLAGNIFTTGPIDADCTVTASFAALPTHTVTPVAGSGGGIAPNTPQTIADGATTAFAITPDAHFAIAGVDGCGGTLDGTTYTTAAITADCTVTASFTAITHVVTPVPGAFYGVDPADPQTVNEGDTFPFTINLVSPAYFIESVTGCDGNLVDSVFTAGPVAADCSFTVNVGVSDAEIVFGNGFDSPTR